MTRGADDDPVMFRFFNEVGIIEQLARNRFERLLPDGLKVAQFTVLNHFVRLGGERTPAELARAFQVTKGAMTNTLQRLEARRLIRIRPDAHDGRVKRVSITKAGIKMRNQAVAALAPVMADLSEQFPEAAFDRALPFLSSLRAALDAARDGQS